MTRAPADGGSSGSDGARAVRGVAWGGVESAAGAITGLVVTPLIVRAFGIEGLGLWAACWSLAHSAGLLDLGIGASYARFTARAIARGDAAELNGTVAAGVGLHLLLAAAIGALGAAAGPLVVSAFAPSDALRGEAALLLGGALAVVVLRLILSAYRGVLAGAQRIDILGRIGALVTLVEGAGAVTIVLAHGPLRLLALNALAAAALASALEGLAAHRVCPELRVRPWRARNEQWRPLFGFALKLQAARTAEVLAHHGPRVVLAAGPGLAAAGVYDLAARVARAMQAVGTLPLPVVQPLATRLQALGEDRRLALLLQRATRYVGLLTIPCAAVLILDAPGFLFAWTGDAAAATAAAAATRLLVASAAITLLASPARLVLRGLGHAGLEASAAGAGAALHLTLAVVLAASLGAEGVALGALLGAVLAASWLGLGGSRLRRDLLAFPFLASLGGALAAGLLAFAGGWLVRSLVVPSALPAIAGRGAALVHLAAESAGAGLFFFVAALVSGGLRRDDLALLRAARGTA